MAVSVGIDRPSRAVDRRVHRSHAWIWGRSKTKEKTMGKAPRGDGMGALGGLICRLNPYTELPQDGITGLSTGDMEVETLPRGNVTAAQTLAQTKRVQAGMKADTEREDKLIDSIAGIGIEVEDNYGAKWTFKG